MRRDEGRVVDPPLVFKRAFLGDQENPEKNTWKERIDTGAEREEIWRAETSRDRMRSPRVCSRSVGGRKDNSGFPEHGLKRCGRVRTAPSKLRSKILDH
ncbi:hypothetical protein TNCV_5071131 [Trichonephila clavipes]|nr:hypothetical protein TNCV_5071131 [Trichonephila clavipes]